MGSDQIKTRYGAFRDWKKAQLSDLQLHDNTTRIVPGRNIGLCLRIRRFGVRIPSGAAYRGH
jgi:hypothetical protein